MKCSSQVENKKELENMLQSNEEEPEYSPKSDEEFDGDMYDDTNDDTYGEDCIVNCDTVPVLHAEYDMVSEVSEAEEDFMPDKTVGGKPLCYYVMNSGVVEEKKAMFERPNPGMMYHLKPLFIRAKINGGLIAYMTMSLWGLRKTH